MQNARIILWRAELCLIWQSGNNYALLMCSWRLFIRHKWELCIILCIKQKVHLPLIDAHLIRHTTQVVLCALARCNTHRSCLHIVLHWPVFCNERSLPTTDPSKWDNLTTRLWHSTVHDCISVGCWLHLSVCPNASPDKASIRYLPYCMVICFIFSRQTVVWRRHVTSLGSDFERHSTLYMRVFMPIIRRATPWP